MKRFIYFLIPVLTLVLFGIIINLDIIVKNRVKDDTNIRKHLQKIEINLKNKHWQVAEEKLSDLKMAWKRVIPMIQYSVELDEVKRFEGSMARLKGALISKDFSASMQHIYEAVECWEDLGN